MVKFDRRKELLYLYDALFGACMCVPSEGDGGFSLSFAFFSLFCVIVFQIIVLIDVYRDYIFTCI